MSVLAATTDIKSINHFVADHTLHGGYLYCLYVLLPWYRDFVVFHHRLT